MIRGDNIRIRFITDLGEYAVDKKEHAKIVREYMEWVKNEICIPEGKTRHHILGSISHNLKTTDLIIIPLTTIEHEEAENNKSGVVKNYLPDSFRNLNLFLAHKKGESLSLDLDPLDPVSWVTLIKEVKK